MNLPNSYITRVFPHKIARARLVYLQFMYIGQIVGPIMITAALKAGDKAAAGDVGAYNWAWAMLGGFYLVCSLFVGSAAVVIRGRLAALNAAARRRHADLTPHQHRIAHATGAQPSRGSLPEVGRLRDTGVAAGIGGRGVHKGGWAGRGAAGGAPSAAEADDRGRGGRHHSTHWRLPGGDRRWLHYLPRYSGS